MIDSAYRLAVWVPWIHSTSRILNKLWRYSWRRGSPASPDHHEDRDGWKFRSQFLPFQTMNLMIWLFRAICVGFSRSPQFTELHITHAYAISVLLSYATASGLWLGSRSRYTVPVNFVVRWAQFLAVPRPGFKTEARQGFLTAMAFLMFYNTQGGSSQSPGVIWNDYGTMC